MPNNVANDNIGIPDLHNQEIELIRSKEIIKIMNISGQESTKNNNTVIYIYNDRSIRKTRQLE